jgi:hypothetical protein
MALMFLFTGISGTAICLCGFFNRRLKNLEKDLPDHDVRVMGEVNY